MYLMRHGTTTLHGLYVGSTDVSLNREGRAKVIRTGEILAGEHIEQVFCSPMKRCRETLDLLRLDVSSEIEKDLREINFGRWEGRSFKEISKTDSDLIEDWRVNSESFCFPEGECVKAFNRRVGAFAQKVATASGNRILIVAHGGTIRHLLCTFLGLAPEKRMIFDIQAGAFSIVTLYDNIGALTGLNVTPHKGV